MFISGGALGNYDAREMDVNIMSQVIDVIALPPETSSSKYVENTAKTDLLWICKTDDVHSGFTKFLNCSTGQYYTRNDMVPLSDRKGPAAVYKPQFDIVSRDALGVRQYFTAWQKEYGFHNVELTGMDFVPV